MKLKRLRLIEGEQLGLLQGHEHVFATTVSPDIEPYCFVGANGTGKSRILQCIAEIYYWIDGRTRNFKPDLNAEIGFRFELEYEIDGDTGLRHIVIRNVENIRRPEVVEMVAEDELVLKSEAEIRDVLPNYIVGYTSGENETLSIPFLEVKADYAAEVRERALYIENRDEDIPDLRLVMMDYQSNLAILVSNFLLQSPDKLEFFKEYIRVQGIESFRIVIQLNHTIARKKVAVEIRDGDGVLREETREGVQLVPQLEEYIDSLKRCSTCYSFDIHERKWVFDYFVNEATSAGFMHFFENAYNLCMALNRISMLNELMVPRQHRLKVDALRRTQKIVVKPPVPAEEDKVFRIQAVRLNLDGYDQAADYINLSDGEHQFVHIFGTLLMFDHPNILFLLDEAESHFNPQWRIKFVSLLNQIAAGRRQVILLTSHAPFVISDCKAENVSIFQRTPDGQHIEVRQPKFETYGSSFDRLLDDVFSIKPPVSTKSLEDLRDLQRDGTEDDINRRIDDFGESSEKFYLFQKLEELKIDRKEDLD